MSRTTLNRFLPHIAAVLIYAGVALAFFYPQLQGKQLSQHDIDMWRGSAQENLDFKAQTGEQSLWCGTMFSGMPAYLVGVVYPGSLIRYVHRALHFLQRPASFIFVAMLGFYLLLLVMGLNPWLAMVGGLAYGLSTYFFIIIGAGHNAKMIAVAYVPPTIAGMVLALRGKLLAGLVTFAIALSLNIVASHPQISYYGLFVMAAMAIAMFYNALREKTVPMFMKGVGVLAVGTILAVGTNFSRLWFTYDSGKDSIRGRSELTTDSHNRTSGLDKDYALQWSYGKMETFNLLIPNLMGGSSSMDMGTKSHTYQFLRSKGVPNNQCLAFVSSMPTYWGPQPMTSGPVYIGAIVVFLFVLGLILVKGAMKWALAAVSLLSLMLAWGNNLLPLSNFFLDYFPAYNKFRTVSMILYVAEITMPLLGFMALKGVIDGTTTKQQLIHALKWALGIVGGVCLLFGLFGGTMFNFEASYDASMGLPAEILDALRTDRRAMLRTDAFRSLAFVAIAAGAIYAFVVNKLKQTHFVAVLCIAVLVDLWAVNKRYMSNDQFVSPTKVDQPFVASAADKQIMADKSYFRVFNLTVSPFNDASTSYFHHSIGGYHGAKLRRYQELIDQYLSKFDRGTLNMLNTKYIIQRGEQGPMAQINPEANGPVWFADSLVMVSSADEELAQLGQINTKTTAVVDERFAQHLASFTKGAASPADTIAFESYAPNRVSYTYRSQNARLAVFSEIYYPKGWQARIDGQPAEHFRANYVLRAMILPAGEHKVEFNFEPSMWNIGLTIDYASSIAIFLLTIGSVAYAVIKHRKSEA
ncbi:MAG: YfhO family protein [Bacteroidales bacterium]|nr:YfhO family protein [Bacteroidales bacterium]